MSKLRIAAILVFGMLVPAPSFAIDGVILISQGCAVVSGCFTGDSPGFPININGSRGHSYRLTSNLIVPNENTSGIVVTSPGVSIDLNGFGIVRSGCEGSTVSCVPATGLGSGVEAASDYSGVSVSNGSITGMGRFGVFLQGAQAAATNLRVRWNRREGVFINQAGVATGITAYGNDRAGIFAGFGSIISDNTTYENGSHGIQASAGCLVYRNTTYNNGGDGIMTIGATRVHGNTVRLNTGFGLNLSSDSAYGENAIQGNIAGTVNNGINASGNVCDGSTTCP